MVESLYYQYKPLTVSKIRLLKILPNHDSVKNEGQCEVTIEEFSIDEVDFDALSYTWGSSTIEEQNMAEAQIFTTVDRCYPVICDGKIVRVTRSLRHFLQRLRLFDSPELAEQVKARLKELEQRRSKYIWADMICINQDDLTERAQQVRLMADLYAKARVVVGYLGDPDEYSQGAIETASLLWKVMTNLSERPKHTLPIIESSVFAQVGGQPPTTDQWWEWAILLSRPWFRRTWILQEATVGEGARRTLLMLGMMTDNLDNYLVGLMAVYMYNWQNVLAQRFEETAHTKPRYRRHEETVRSWISRGHPHQQLFQAVHSDMGVSLFTAGRSILPHTRCSDPRDKIYGTLGFISDFRLNGVPSRMMIDYTSSTAEVYSRATAHVFSQSSRLDLLHLVTLRGEDTTLETAGLPSWCPDYNCVKRTPQNVLFDKDRLAESWCASRGSRHTSTNPGPGSGPDQVFSLRVRGKRCGVVTDSIVYQEQFEMYRLFLQLLIDLNLLNSISSKPTTTAETELEQSSASISSLLQSFHRTFVGGRGHDSQGTPHTAPDMILFRATTTIYIVSEIESSTTAEDFAEITAKVNELNDLVEAITRIDPKTTLLLPDINLLQTNLDLQRRQIEKSKRCTFDGQADSDGDQIAARDRWGSYTSLAEMATYQIAMRSGVGVGRSFFVTANNRVGVGHNTLRKGDEVWILAGGSMPFILKPMPDELEQDGCKSMSFVGEAFVDGIMRGELWPDDEEDGLVDIVLK